MRVLIVEDDARTANYIERALVEAGHVVDSVADGGTGLAMASEGIYDLVVLDQMLPEMPGIDVLRALRREGENVLVLVLSALGSATDKVAAFRAGADAYLPKPFAMAELTARIDALLRRAQATSAGSVLQVADLTLDVAGRRLMRGGVRIELQHREFLLVELLMRNAGNVVTRAMLLEAAWPYDFEPRGNIVDMHIHRLRRKIDEPFATALIHTVPGAGYVLKTV